MSSYHHTKIQRTLSAITSVLCIAFLSLWASLSSAAAILPTLPQVFIDTTYTPQTGNTITVNAGGDFQAALNNANLGDTIVLQAGATFTGPFTLPNKTVGSGWIYIISSNYSNLPAIGNRVGPSDAVNMPKILANAINGGGAINTMNNANHYRFVGIEFKPVQGQSPTYLITIGDANNPETSTSLLPHDFTFDRCYIHGDPIAGGRRGIAMNGINVAVADSYVSGFFQPGSDSQALWSANSPGPLKIHNNYLEAASENVLFGGQDPAIANVVPANIEITQNYFFKPLSWMSAVPALTVKNLLEIKSARRVLVEGNIFENVWGEAQAGFAILITPKNQNGGAPWTTTEDITFRLNFLKNIGSGINVCGGVSGGCTAPPVQTASRILIENNIFEVSGLNSSATVFQIIEAPNNVTINHNTALSAGSFGVVDFGVTDGSTPMVSGFAFTNNLLTEGGYGFKGSGKQEGMATLNSFFTNWTFSNNAIIGAPFASYPPSNYFPVNIGAIGYAANFVIGADYPLGSYLLPTSSPYKSLGTDGKDLGADINALTVAISGVNGARGSVLISPLNLHVFP